MLGSGAMRRNNVGRQKEGKVNKTALLVNHWQGFFIVLINLVNPVPVRGSHRFKNNLTPLAFFEEATNVENSLNVLEPTPSNFKYRSGKIQIIHLHPSVFILLGQSR
jgi:hypothetical protein